MITVIINSMTNMNLDEIGSLKDISGLIFDNYLDELGGFYLFIHPDMDNNNYRIQNDKVPNEIIRILKILGLSNIKTYLDLYNVIINPTTQDKLSDDNFLQVLCISDDDIIKANEINDYHSMNNNKSHLVRNLMKLLSGKQAETNNHIITMIADIDDNSMPGLLIKQILLLDYINNNDIDYSNNKSNRLISNDACEWLIANMNASMLSLKTESCNAGLTAILIKDAYDFITNNNVRPYQLPLTAISNILMTAYNIKDTNLYANALVAALFMTMAFIELNKVNDNDYIDNMNFIFSDYKNLKAISEFISSELAPNLDKPIEFITELVKVNIQDMLK